MLKLAVAARALGPSHRVPEGTMIARCVVWACDRVGLPTAPDKTVLCARCRADFARAALR